MIYLTLRDKVLEQDTIVCHILFHSNLKGTAESLAVNLLRLNTPGGTKPLFQPLKGVTSKAYGI